MLTVEAFKNRFVRQAAIGFSQSVELFSSINSAARLIGHDMKDQEIRSANDRIALITTMLVHAPTILDKIGYNNQTINSLGEEIIRARRMGSSEEEATLRERRDEYWQARGGLYQQLENIRRAAGLTLNEHDFSHPNLSQVDLGLVVLGLGKGARDWNKFALLVPCGEKGREIVQEAAVTQKERPSTTAIEISLARLSFPYVDVPDTVKAKMVPLVTIDGQGVKLDKLQVLHIYTIYNAQHVMTTIKSPLFSPRLVYRG